MKLIAANPKAAVEGLDKRPGVSNYFKGNDPSKWLTNIPNYAKVRYHDIYPGIDLIYYGDPRQLEYDFVVSPTANVNPIQIAFEGADGLSFNKNGDLQIAVGGTEILQHRPQVYQLNEGRKIGIAGEYRLSGKTQVAISVGEHDVTQALYIDPVMTFSFTFTGGGFGSAIVLDSSGSAYITGVTGSENFQTTPGAFQSSGEAADVFVAKLNPSGTELVYSTHLGGGASEIPYGLAVDLQGNAYIAGYTNSSNFPTTPGSFQSAYANGSAAYGPSDAFVTKLNATGTALVYSTYLGGSGTETPAGIRLNAAGEAFVAGTTDSIDFPVTVGAYQTHYLGGSFASGGGDAFATKLNSAGTGLFYSTYLGSTEADSVSGLALDSHGNVYVAGQTNPLNYFGEGFVMMLNSSGTSQIYSTHLAGGVSLTPAGTDKIEVDSAGNAWVLDSQSLKKLNPHDDSIQMTIPFGGFDPRFDITNFALGVAGDLYVTGWKSTGATIYCGGSIGYTSYEHQDVCVAKLSETESTTLFVPIVLSAAGLNNSFFTSELTLINAGPKDAKLNLTYVAAFGVGSGTVTTTLAARRQQIFPDGIEYLRSLGMSIPANGNRGGTLTIHASRLSSSSDIAAMVRTTTKVDQGRAGLAYAAIPLSNTLHDPVYLCGLRQNDFDRSNVAVQNAGGPDDGEIVLLLSINSGERSNPVSFLLPDLKLGPGEFHQFNGILNSNGISLRSGYVRVEKLSGSAPYYAYGVVNDQASSDGSFVPPTPQFLAAGQDGLWLPAVVESSQYNTEVIVTNWSGSSRVIRLQFQSEALQNEQKTTFVKVELEPGEQKIIPDFVHYLRDNGIGEVGPVGPTYVGTVAARDATILKCTNLQGIAISARTSAQGAEGRYGVFCSGVPRDDTLAFSSIWLYGLQQNSENRTNLALADTGFLAYEQQVVNEFRVDLFDGESGAKVNVIEGLTLNPGEWKQIGSLLRQYAPGTQQRLRPGVTDKRRIAIYHLCSH